MKFGEIENEILCEVAGLHDVPDGAYNFRINGRAVGRRSTDNINIVSKSDVSGLDIHIKPGAKNAQLHIPVAISASGLSEVVYNEFYIGEGADVIIVAGCGIYNCGSSDSIHDGVHRFHIGKGAKIKYIEKHYGFGTGGGGRILNPVTEVFMDEGSEAILEMEQIKGVDSTKRKTTAHLKSDAKLLIRERLLTHGKQRAESVYKITLDGDDATADISSRSVARDYSEQVFRSRIVGSCRCRGHSECDAIVMDQARVLAIPSLDALSVEAELIHEAAIGKIAGEQLLKLMTLGLTIAEAESKIINGFLR